MADHGNNEREERDEPVVRDRRRIDPETGEAREPAGGASHAAGPRPAANGAGGAAGAPEDGSGDELSADDRALLDDEAAKIDSERSELEATAAKHFDELQRLQAEYVNYRNRTERDRATDRQASVASVVQALLPALDDLDRAEQHGDLEGSPLALVAQKIRGAFAGLGLEPVGASGDSFDPSVHEAIAQFPSPEVTELTVGDVVQRGYRIGERLLRPAKVAVLAPAESGDAAPGA